VHALGPPDEEDDEVPCPGPPEEEEEEEEEEDEALFPLLAPSLEPDDEHANKARRDEPRSRENRRVLMATRLAMDEYFACEE
jgi:hypothetical protein